MCSTCRGRIEKTLLMLATFFIMQLSALSFHTSEGVSKQSCVALSLSQTSAILHGTGNLIPYDRTFRLFTISFLLFFFSSNFLLSLTTFFFTIPLFSTILTTLRCFFRLLCSFPLSFSSIRFSVFSLTLLFHFLFLLDSWLSLSLSTSKVKPSPTSNYSL